MRRALVIFLTSFLLWALVAQVNDALAGWRVYLSVGGLFVVYAALTLPLRDGLVATFLAVLLCDAAAPVAFGTQAILFVTAHTVLFHLRDRLPRDETVSRVLLALLANLAFFLAISFVEVTRSPSPAAAWTRLLADLVCSQLFLALVAPWFFALQTRALEFAPARRDEIG